MGDLDKWFGYAKETQELEAEPHTWRWRAEENILPILDVMMEVSGIDPGPWLRKQWVAGARDWRAEHGEDAELLRRALRYMRKRDLVIKSPRSAIAVGHELKSRPDPDDPRGL